MIKKDIVGNLVWIDLEMSGLNVYTDAILEIASVITDGNLNVIAKGPSFIIYQPESVLLGMDQWCSLHHGKSGLTASVRASTTSLADAYDQTLDFIKHHCPLKTGILAGNSVWQDRIFLSKYMPAVVDYLHYRIVDVTTIKVLASHWYPESSHAEYKKKNSHRAVDDIFESIEELKHYRKNFFIQ